jgi:SAM-dependent methyltransferase
MIDVKLNRQSKPMDANNTLKQAIALQDTKQFSRARELYLTVLQETPDHAYANHNLGDLLVQIGQPEVALPYFAAALNADPTCRQFWLSCISALLLTDNAKEASKILNFAKEHGLSGNDVDSIATRIRHLIENGMRESASEQTDQGPGIFFAMAKTHHDAADNGGDTRSALNQTTYCPVCNSSHVTFLPIPEFYREQAQIHGYKFFGQGEMISVDTYSCSNCGASDRERIYSFWIDQQIESGAFQGKLRTIHFAPEPALSNKLSKMEYLEYITADLLMDTVHYKMDIANMPFRDGSFDFFICSHVLEHVENDDQAIEELYRITRNGGVGILVAPVCLALEKTCEDPRITDEAGRWRMFGQSDHVRLYAHDDFTRKIRAHGFQLDELGASYFGDQVFRSLGLKSTSILYIARKIGGNRN